MVNIIHNQKVTDGLSMSSILLEILFHKMEYTHILLSE